MSAQHTPGPWRISDHPNVMPPNYAAAVVPGGTGGAIAHILHNNWVANARLIAKAPEMRALLEVLADSQADDPENEEARRILAEIDGTT